MSPLGKYLSDVSEIHRSGAGVPETSYYPAIRDLFNDVGKTLKPAVRCLVHLHNTGAGIPDGGLFTAQQLRGDPASNWDDVGLTPERGALEVKPPSEDVMSVALSTQVCSYLETYGLVLVTNLREFVLVRRNGQGEPTILERFMLAPSEAEFWTLTIHPQKAAHELGERFVEYLRRVTLAKAELVSPKQVAWFLASYARDARARIEHADLQALTAVRGALESSLGLTFEGERGDHFFRSTLIQTLFYGLFSAWVLWCRTHRDNEGFDWKDAQWSLHVPMIRALFEQVSQPSKLLPLHLVEPLEWAAGVLNRVDRTQFFATFREEQAVQYFYEPFLEEFDPVLRKDLGVWYTPEEIVRYQVERVDYVLRTELDIARGLADPRVVVLDPCCGTGTYLVEVLRRIQRTLKDEGEDALSAQDVKTAAMTRIHGFEIMPAPFVVAHLQLGLLLISMGAPLQNDERVGVYLTNSLTGWTPSASGVHEPTPEERLFPEMTDERDAARNIKQEEQILVVLGNPPYNAFAGVHAEEEGDLVDCYKDGLNKRVDEGGWGIRKFNLDDLYVRFFRIAERRITEGRPGRGVVSYISNCSYLGDPSFVVMRKRLSEEFDAMWFDNMNGDSRATGKKTPDGRPDPSVFSTQYHSVGIKVGTAIATLVRTSPRRQAPTVYYRNFWGASKRQDLLESLATATNPGYMSALPSTENKYSFRPCGDTAAYDAWPKVTELAQEAPLNGPVERRGNSLIVFPEQRSQLQLVRDWLDPTVSNEAIADRAPRFMKSSGEFDAVRTRTLKLGRGVRYDPSHILSYPFKPFDVRLAYLDPMIQPLFSRPAPALMRQTCTPDNFFFLTRDTADKDPEGVPFFVSKYVCDYDFLSGHARHFSCLWKTSERRGFHNDVGDLGFTNGRSEEQTTANLSTYARSYLALLDITDVDGNVETAGIVWMHALAIGYSPAYLTENANGIRQDWPRVPLPATRKLLESSAMLGKSVAALLDTESPVDGVSAGTVHSDLRTMGTLQVSRGHVLDTVAGDLSITAGWGHGGLDGVTMPGRGRLTERDYTAAECAAITAGALALGMTFDEALNLLGRRTYDVWLNDLAFWQNVPVNVWNYVIGGYQVIKKWLSYRERTLLGRDLTIDEARYVTEMVRRLSALILLQPRLDENYHAVAAATGSLGVSDPDVVGPRIGVVAGDTPAGIGGTE
ncbi:MAG: N-6 DNA methylase [Caldiserica bacterium]|nr:N-6 DNA methylase [Caldisericota bacterium]